MIGRILTWLKTHLNAFKQKNTVSAIKDIPKQKQPVIENIKVNCKGVSQEYLLWKKLDPTTADFSFIELMNFIENYNLPTQEYHVECTGFGNHLIIYGPELANIGPILVFYISSAVGEYHSPKYTNPPFFFKISLMQLLSEDSNGYIFGPSLQAQA